MAYITLHLYYSLQFFVFVQFMFVGVFVRFTDYRNREIEELLTHVVLWADWMIDSAKLGSKKEEQKC